MADQSTAFLQQPQFLDPEQQQQLNEIARKQKMAQLLTQTGMTPVQGQAVGNRYVAPAWSQYANQLFSAYAGRKTAEEAESMQTKLAQALKGQQAQEITKFNELLKTDPNAAYNFAAQSSVPELKSAGLKKMLPQEFDLSEGQVRYTTTPTGEIKEVARGGEKYHAPISVDTGNGTVLLDPKTMKPIASFGKEKPLPEAAVKQVTGAENLKSAIVNYKEKLKDFKTLDMANPSARAEMGNAYNNMMLQAKEAYNLGVLNGPDYQILQSVVKDPTAASSVFVSKKTLDKQADELNKTADTIIANINKTHNRAVPQGSAQSNKPAQAPTASAPVYAVNPQTGQRIVSNDGGKTWTGAK